MQRIMLKSKIHRATVTGADLHYEGSLAVDAALLEAADILPGEQIQVFNVHNGQRFTTYAIEAPRGSGTILVNGAAARLAAPGDPVIIVTFAHVADGDAQTFKARVVLVDSKNRPLRKRR